MFSEGLLCVNAALKLQYLIPNLPSSYLNVNDSRRHARSRLRRRRRSKAVEREGQEGMQSRGRVYTGKWVAERETPSSRDTKIAIRRGRGCEVGGERGRGSWENSKRRCDQSFQSVCIIRLISLEIESSQLSKSRFDIAIEPDRQIHQSCQKRTWHWDRTLCSS